MATSGVAPSTGAGALPSAAADGDLSRLKAVEELKAALLKAVAKPLPQKAEAEAFRTFCLCLRQLAKQQPELEELVLQLPRLGETRLGPLLGIGGQSRTGAGGRAAPAPAAGAQRATGRVKSYNTKKGFGFIEMPNYEQDIFVHNAHLIGRIGLIAGESVSFELILDGGRPQARQVRALSGTDGQAPVMMGMGMARQLGMLNPLSAMRQAVARPHAPPTRDIASSMAAAAVEVPAHLSDALRAGQARQAPQERPADEVLFEKIQDAQKASASEKRRLHGQMPSAVPDQVRLAMTALSADVPAAGEVPRSALEGGGIPPARQSTEAAGPPLSAALQRSAAEALRRFNQQLPTMQPPAPVPPSGQWARPPGTLGPLPPHLLGHAPAGMQHASGPAAGFGSAAFPSPLGIVGGPGYPQMPDIPRGASGFPPASAFLAQQGPPGQLGHPAAPPIPGALLRSGPTAPAASTPAAATAPSASLEAGRHQPAMRPPAPQAAGLQPAGAGPLPPPGSSVAAMQLGQEAAVQRLPPKESTFSLDRSLAPAAVPPAAVAAAATHSTAAPFAGNGALRSGPAVALSAPAPERRAPSRPAAPLDTATVVAMAAATAALLPADLASSIGNQSQTPEPGHGWPGARWRVRNTGEFADVVVRETMELESRELGRKKPDEILVQRGPTVRLATGLVRLPIEPAGWVTVTAKPQGGPTFLEEFTDEKPLLGHLPSQRSSSSAAAPSRPQRTLSPPSERQPSWLGAGADPQASTPSADNAEQPRGSSEGPFYDRDLLLHLREGLLARGQSGGERARDRLKMLHLPSEELVGARVRRPRERPDRPDRDRLDRGRYGEDDQRPPPLPGQQRASSPSPFQDMDADQGGFGMAESRAKPIPDLYAAFPEDERPQAGGQTAACPTQ